MINLIKTKMSETRTAIDSIIKDDKLVKEINAVAQIICNSLQKSGKVFFAGNGGSAADSQHLAAELVSKFYLERQGLAAEALSVNTSVLTAIGNDYGFERVFARQLEANAKRGDVFVGITTSGNSKNIVEAVKECKKKGIITVLFSGESGGMLRDMCDFVILAPSNDTPRIQECHILIGHIICEIVEKTLFKEAK